MDADGESKRTDLAVERTMLAWWRSALASLAVGVGIGRILPELDKEASSTPYVAVGLCFAAYALGLFGYGTWEGATVNSRSPRIVASIAAGGGLLCLAVAALIVAA